MTLKPVLSVEPNYTAMSGGGVGRRARFSAMLAGAVCDAAA